MLFHRHAAVRSEYIPPSTPRRRGRTARRLNRSALLLPSAPAAGQEDDTIVRGSPAPPRQNPAGAGGAKEPNSATGLGEGPMVI